MSYPKPSANPFDRDEPVETLEVLTHARHIKNMGQKKRSDDWPAMFGQFEPCLEHSSKNRYTCRAPGGMYIRLEGEGMQVRGQQAKQERAPIAGRDVTPDNTRPQQSA
jgi:catalase (peroxidase I)